MASPGAPNAAAAARYQRIDEGCGLGAVGRGSYGKVYVALDRETGETVAVKRQQLPSRAATTELSIFKALSQVPHQNVLRLLNSFTATAKQQQFLYMVFEFLDTSLQDLWLHHRGVLPMQLATRCQLHAVRGVCHIHGQGILHGDLSLGNLLVGRDNTLRVADFGGAACARTIVLASSQDVGTLYIRAPELLLGTLHPTLSVDLWALGVVACSLWTGTCPFYRFGVQGDSDTATSSAERTLSRQAMLLGPITPEVWPGCEEAVEGDVVGFKPSRAA